MLFKGRYPVSHAKCHLAGATGRDDRLITIRISVLCFAPVVFDNMAISMECVLLPFPIPTPMYMARLLEDKLGLLCSL